MAIQIKKKPGALQMINVTPLIDVVLFLLIFLMVAMDFAKTDQQVPIKLPSAASAVPMTVEPNDLTVLVDAEGGYQVNGERVTLGRLESIISQVITDNPVNQTVIIRGDKTVAFQSIVSVLDVCNRLKVPSYRITAEDEKKE